MRKVMVSRYKRQDNNSWCLEEVGEALFHQFGLDYEEFDNGAASFSSAIVEWPDGQVENVPAEHIRFLDNE